MIPKTRTTAKTVVAIFLEHWVSKVGIPTKILTDSGPQYTTKYLVATCTQLGVETKMTTEYHRKANGQVENFNRIIVSRLQYYVTELRKARVSLVIPLNYGHNAHVHNATELPPFNPVHSREPPGQVTICPPTVPGSSDANSVWSQRLQIPYNAPLLRKIASVNLR